MFSLLQKMILLTRAYCRQFNYALTPEELKLRLIDFKFSSPISFKSLSIYQDLALKKITEFRQILFLIKKIPWIQAVVVTGSVAMNNAKSSDDLDLLVICQPNTLWLVRPILLFLAFLLGKKRGKRGNHKDNSWCFNIFLEIDGLKIPSSWRNIFNAYELMQAKFIYDRGGAEGKWLQDNKWVERVLPNYYVARCVKLTHSYTNQPINRSTNKLICWLNHLAFYLQYNYMKASITREKVSLHAAWFHPRDTRKMVMERWRKSVKNLAS